MDDKKTTYSGSTSAEEQVVQYMQVNISLVSLFISASDYVVQPGAIMQKRLPTEESHSRFTITRGVSMDDLARGRFDSIHQCSV